MYQSGTRPGLMNNDYNARIFQRIEGTKIGSTHFLYRHYSLIHIICMIATAIMFHLFFFMNDNEFYGCVN